MNYSLAIFVILTAYLCNLSHCQDASDINFKVLETIVNKIDRLSRGLEGLHDRMTELEVDQGAKPQDELLKGIKRTLEMEFQKMNQRVESCSASTILSDLHELVATGTEELQSSREMSEGAPHNHSTDTTESSPAETHPQEAVQDECMGTNRCSSNAFCEDNLIGYKCTCKPGYTGDGFDCQDVDECTTDANACHYLATCKNIEGNYTCYCPHGSAGDGYHFCEDPPCVYPSKEIDGLGCVTPEKKGMPWSKASQNCLDKHRSRLLEGITTVQQLELLKEYFQEFLDYGFVWLGVTYWRWTEGKDTVPPPFRDYHYYLTGTESECGMVVLYKSPPSIGDGSCSITYPSLCQRNVTK